MQMQAKGAHLQNERIDERTRNAKTFMLRQRGAQHFEVVEKLFDRTVRGQHFRQLLLSLSAGERYPRQRCARHAAAFPSFIKQALDARLDANDKAAVVL